jgi:hypothetical protein
VGGADYPAATGNMTKSPTQVSIASWSNSGNKTGTVAYSLANSYAYNAGTYTTQFRYTLIAQ